jgi:hypothetical protein
MRISFAFISLCFLLLGFGQAKAQFLFVKEFDVHATAQDYDCHFMEDNKVFLVAYKGNRQVREIRVPERISYKGRSFAVVRIGSSCFAKLKVLEKVVLPSSLTNIDARAFEYCSNLYEINFPPHLLEIEHAVFNQCFALDTITLPASLQKIGWRAFSSCKQLAHIKVEVGSLYFVAVDGVLYNKNKDTLYLFPPNKKRENFYHNFYKGIIEGAFDDNQHIKKITFPDSLLYLPSCLYKCASLEQIDIGSLTEQISFHLNLQHCPQLRNVFVDTLNPYYRSLDGVLYDKTFARLLKCPDAKISVEIDPRCWVIDNYALLGCKQIKVLVIPEGVKKIKFNALAQTQFHEVRFLPPQAPEGSYYFSPHTLVYVPLASQEAYSNYLKKEFYWKNKTLHTF